MLFAAVCRLLNAMEIQGSSSVSQAEREVCWGLARDFLLENINKVSLDYCNDWAEAIAYGFGEYPQEVRGQEPEGGSGGSSNVLCWIWQHILLKTPARMEWKRLRCWRVVEVEGEGSREIPSMWCC